MLRLVLPKDWTVASEAGVAPCLCSTSWIIKVLRRSSRTTHKRRQTVKNIRTHKSDQIRQNRSEFPALWESGGWGNCRDCAVQAVVAAEAQGAPEPRTNAHTAESSEVAHRKFIASWKRDPMVQSGVISWNSIFNYIDINGKRPNFGV